MSLVDEALREELAGLYMAPDRHYHNLNHIKALLRLLEANRAEFADAEAIEAAIWFHDAIYDSRAKDNEAKSAALAVEKLTGAVEPKRVARIAAMIEATATHTVPEFAHAASRSDAALFLDMDLSILGAPPADFDAYELAVRKEYGWVAEEAWREGRAAVLRTFLSREHIFHTDTFRRIYEARARKNMARSLVGLEG